MSDENNESKFNSYTKISHLYEILQLFPKKTIEINEDVYDRIKNELNILEIYDYNKLNNVLMKKILKKLELQKYYECINHIIYKLNNIQSNKILMTREQEENIIKMFKEICDAFLICNNGEIKIFLNYNYVIYKICELCEYSDLLLLIPLIRSVKKLEYNDSIWEKICKIKNYKFIPTV